MQERQRDFFNHIIGDSGYRAYYVLNGEYWETPSTEYNLAYRTWNEYENLDYAVENSACIPKYRDIYGIYQPFDLVFTGMPYWYSQVVGTGYALRYYSYIKLWIYRNSNR